MGEAGVQASITPAFALHWTYNYYKNLHIIMPVRDFNKNLIPLSVSIFEKRRSFGQGQLIRYICWETRVSHMQQ